MSNVEVVQGLVVVEFSTSKGSLSFRELSSKSRNGLSSILKGVLSSSKSGISNVKISLSIISSLGGKSYSILGIDNFSISKSKLVVSIIKKCFSSLNVVPGDVVSVLGILVSSKSDIVVSNGLRKLSLSDDMGSISSFESGIGNLESSFSSSEVGFSFSKNGISVIKGSGEDIDCVFGSVEVSLSNVEGILSSIFDFLSFGEGNLSGVLLGNSKIVGNLSLSLRSLETLGNSFCFSNTL